MTAYESVVEFLTAEGLRKSATNRFGIQTWSRKGVSVTISERCSEDEACRVRESIEKQKSHLERKPKSARARETATKKRAAHERRLREIEAHIAERNRELGGMREHLTSDEARAIIRQIEEFEREYREINSIMTDIPRTSKNAACQSGTGRNHLTEVPPAETRG